MGGGKYDVRASMDRVGGGGGRDAKPARVGGDSREADAGGEGGELAAVRAPIRVRRALVGSQQPVVADNPTRHSSPPLVGSPLGDGVAVGPWGLMQSPEKKEK